MCLCSLVVGICVMIDWQYSTKVMIFASYLGLATLGHYLYIDYLDLKIKLASRDPRN